MKYKKIQKPCDCVVVVLGLVTRLNCTNQAVFVFGLGMVGGGEVGEESRG